MLCQNCQQHEASVHYTQVVNGQKKEMHLCEQCAQGEGYMDFANENLSLHHFLTNMFPFDQTMNQSQQQQMSASKTIQCDGCGLTYHEFRHQGKFGCSQCYEAFADYLDPIFKRVHSGNTEHVGKIPKRLGGDLHKRREIDQLQDDLQRKIHEENFEEAANIRDQIRALKEELHNDDGGET
ncbi:protein arginine kinase activator [Alkalibacillus flavidus]|uniref:Protein arginine kinase activator n=1 Tax=Alkalibacillus flavidus TaxID=546021 RepID=A0ABV2KY67_9BACI